MITPELFFAVCAVVVALIVWLGVSRYRRGKALASVREACRIHKDRADAIGHDRRSVADELVKQQDETQKARRERNSARGERDEALESIARGDAKLKASYGEIAALKEQILDRDNADAARPVLTLCTKESERGRHRVHVKDADGKLLLRSPAGYGTQDKANAIIERLCGSRLEKAE